jgi:release factor glutamine methyltransferase
MIDIKRKEIECTLRKNGVSNAFLEAKWLTESGRSDPDLAELVRRRLSGEPLQYLLGEWEFYGLPFKVGKGVLIPRQETELLVDVSREFLNKQSAAKPVDGTHSGIDHQKTVFDLFSGSGCVGVALAKYTGCRVAAVDNSSAANNYAKINAEKNNVRHLIQVYNDTVFGLKLRRFLRMRYALADVITANPPYLTAKDMSELQREVTHEPEYALYGGYDGLVFYKKLFTCWKRLLRPGGLFVTEVGDGQAPMVAEYMRQAGFADPQIRKDYGGTERVVMAVNDWERVG